MDGFSGRTIFGTSVKMMKCKKYISSWKISKNLRIVKKAETRLMISAFLIIV